MHFSRKQVAAQYLIQAPIATIQQSIINYYAAQHIQLFQLPPASPQSITYSFSTDMSFLSWGERINITLNPAEENSTYLDMASQSTWGIVDYGINKKNIEKLIGALTPYFAVTVLRPPARV